MLPQSILKNCTIFKTKNNELAVFGKTLTDVRNKFIEFTTIYEQYGLKGESGVFASLFSNKESVKLFTPELEDEFKIFQEMFNNSSKNAEVLSEELGGVSDSILNYAKNCENGKLTIEGFKNSLNGLSLSAKASKLALSALATAGNMFISWAFAKGIELAVTAIHNYINRVEIAEEKTIELLNEYENISSEVTTLEGKLKELNEQINGLDPITDEQDIKNLKLETAELNAQLAILREKQAIAKQEAEDAATESLNIKQGSKYAFDYKTYVDYTTGTTYEGKSNREVTSYQELDLAMDAYDEYANKVLELQEELSKLEESDPEYSKKSSEIQEWSDKMKDARSHASDLATSIQSQVEALPEGHELKSEITPVIEAYLEWIGKINSTTDALKENSNAVDNFGNKTAVLLGIDETITELNKLKPAMDALGDAYKDIFTSDGFTRESIGLDMFTSIRDELDELAEIGINIDTSAFEEFVDVLSDVESKPEDIQKQFDSLGSRIANTTDYTTISSEAFDTLKQSLTQLGLTDADEVLNRLKTAQEEIVSLGYDLSDITYEQAKALIEEGKASAIAAEYLQWYMFIKLANQPLKTSADVEALESLCNSLGVTGELLKAVISLKSALGAVDAGAPIAAFQDQIDKANAKIAELATYGGSFSFDFGVEDSSKVGSKAGDAYVKAFEEELKSLEILRDRGEITEKEYLDRLRDLYTKYFADREEYIDELRKYETEYLEGMESLHSKAVSAISKLLDKRIDSVEKEKDTVIDALEEERDARLEVIETQKEQLEAQKDLIDEQIEAKEEIIDGIQDEIDKMREANEERKRQIDLQKAKYDLERMQNQNTNLVFKDNQMIYVPNEEGIRDAREKLADTEFEIAISKKEKEISLIEEEIKLLEKQKDAIDDQIDALNKQAENIEKTYDKMIKQQEKLFDSMIEKMNEQKSKWEELADIKEVADAYSTIEQVFGDLGYTVEDVLNGSTGAFEDFKAKYLAILSDMGKNTSFQDGLAYASGVAKESFGSIVNTAQDELSKMNQLGSDAGKGFVEGWNEKAEEIKNATKQTAEEAVNAFAEGQHSNSPSEDYKSKAYDAIDGLTTGIDERKQSFIDSVKSMAEEGVLAFGEGFNFKDSTLVNSFDSLKLLIQSVCEAVGLGTEDSVGGLLGALTSLSTLSLGDEETGIIAQFNALKTAVDEVTSSISGGGSKANESGGLATGANGGSATPNGEGQSGLTGAITEIGTTTEETLGTADSEGGESDSEGEGVLGKFSKFKTAVDEVTKAIGTGEEESNEESTSLISALQKHYETAEETLPQVKTFFEELLVSITACVDKLNELGNGISSLGNGGIPVEPNAKGTSYASKGLHLVGEEAPELIEDTKGNLSLATQPTLLNMEGGEKVYNGEETEELLNPLEEIDPIYAMHLKAKAYYEQHPELLFPTHNIMSSQMQKNIDSLKNMNVVNNNRTQTIEQHNQFNVTLPNINDSSKAIQLYNELKRLPNETYQHASITR